MPKNIFFGDVTFDHDKLFTKGFSYGTPFYFKARSSPDASTKLLNRSRVDASGDALAVRNVATLKYSWDMYSTKTKIQNSAFGFEIKAKPADFNDEDKSVEVKSATNYKTNGGAWDTTAALKFGLPSSGVFFTFDYVKKMGGAMLLKSSFNANVADDFHLGGKVEHDTAALTAAHLQLAFKQANMLAYLKFDKFKNNVIVGGTYKCDECKSEIYKKVTYDLDGKLAGFQGHPLEAKVGVATHCSDNFNLKCQATFAKDIMVDYTQTMKYDKNFKLTFSERFNLSQCFSSCEPHLKAGVAFEFAF